VYDRQNLLLAMNSLNDNLYNGRPRDLTISSYRNQKGLKGYLLEPNLVEHIGLQSSLGDGKHVADRDNGDYTEYLYHQPI